MDNLWGTGRTEIFSDGVFAIAITLLVLDIKVPEAAFDDLWRGIADEWPAYLAYATSFITIGGLWLAHHGFFRRLQHVDQWLLRFNLLLLMAVAFLPFPTRLLAEAIRDTHASRAAVIFYGASLLVISLLLTAMVCAVARRPALLKPEVSQQQLGAIMRVAAPNLGFCALVILLAIVAPQVAAFGYLLVAIVVVLRVRGDEGTRSAPSEAA